MNIRLIETPLAVPRYRQVRLPTVAAEFAPYARVEINDENIEPVDYSPVDLVGITAQAYNAPRAMHLADKFRSLGIPVILGGPASFMTGMALEHFDAVVVGEVEGLGETIVRDVEKGGLNGVYRLDRPPKNWGRNLPLRSLQNSSNYYWLNFPIEFSRGCPHQCSFCFGRKAYPGFRTRNLDDIAAELDQWDHGIVEAVDLHFAGDPEYAMEVCRLLEQKKVQGWMCEATIKSMDNDKLLRQMELSNCKAVFVGMESVEQNALGIANKTFNNPSEYYRIIRKIQAHGIFVHAGLMWGLDGQSPDSFEATAQFCEEAGIFLASTNLATWFPETDAFHDLDNQDKILTHDLRKYDGAHVTAKTDLLDEKQIYDGTKDFLKKFYSYKSIFWRSFQTPNYNLAHLADYWALNLNYRAYYKKWARRLGGDKTPWAVDGAEKEAMPLVGGKMPLIYGWGDMSLKFFHKWYAAWDKEKAGVSILSAMLPVLLWFVAGLFAFKGAQAWVASQWPVKAPSPGAVICVYIALYWAGAWLAARTARAGPPEQFKPPPGILKAAPILCAAPLFLCSAIMHTSDGEWAFILGIFSLVFLLKGWSVLVSESTGKNIPLRVVCFVVYFPGLDFDSSFVPERKKDQIIRHLLMSWAGFFKIAAGTAAALYLAEGVYRYQDQWLMQWPLSFGRLLATYMILSGFLEWQTSYWRAAGYVIPDPFARRPFGPAAPSKIWKAWNIPFGDFMVRHVYIPLGGKNKPALASTGLYLVLGILAASVVFACSGTFAFEIILFFLLNSLPVIVEKSLFPEGAPEKWKASLFLLAALTFLLTAPLLFGPVDRIFW